MSEAIIGLRRALNFAEHRLAEAERELASWANPERYVLVKDMLVGPPKYHARGYSIRCAGDKDVLEPIFYWTHDLNQAFEYPRHLVDRALEQIESSSDSQLVLKLIVGSKREIKLE